MAPTIDALKPFQEICRKICLNIPNSYKWEWDAQRKMAAVILDDDDAEMVFYPLFKEFRNHWNFASIGEAADAVNDYIHAEYGLMPGQVFFTSHMVEQVVLGVAWWPWGNDDKVSMRVGLIPVNIELSENFTYQCIDKWLGFS